MSEHYIASLIESFRKDFESFRKDCEAAHAADRAAWEAKEKALRELANEWASFSWAPFMNPAARLKAILNTPAASGGRT